MNNEYLSPYFVENKIASKRSLIEFFALKHNSYYPSDSNFNTGFAIGVFNGSKRLLSLSELGSPKIGEIKGDNSFGKENLISICKRDVILRQFIPEDANYKRISKNFIYALLFHKRRDIFDDLLKEFSRKKKEKLRSFKQKVNLEIQPQFIQGINDFETNFRSARSKQFLQVKRYMNLLSSNQVINNNQIEREINISDNRQNSIVNQQQLNLNDNESNVNFFEKEDRTLWNNNSNNNLATLCYDIVNIFYTNNSSIIESEILEFERRKMIFEKIVEIMINRFGFEQLNFMDLAEREDEVKNSLFHLYKRSRWN